MGGEEGLCGGLWERRGGVGGCWVGGEPTDRPIDALIAQLSVSDVAQLRSRFLRHWYFNNLFNDATAWMDNECGMT